MSVSSINLDDKIVKLGKSCDYGHPNPKQYAQNSLQFGLLLLTFQCIFIILFALFVDYHVTTDEVVGRNYPWFQDAHVMVVVGFGFLMSFLKRYGMSAVSFNLIFTGFTIQWAIIVMGFFRDFYYNKGHIEMNLERMLDADFTTAGILISFGAVIGIASPVQLIVMIIFEVVFFQLNTWIMMEFFTGASDIGGSLTIHTFGAYFGLAVARILFDKNKEQIDNAAEGSEYHSELFSMIGTCFLWVFWPSFNSAPGGTDFRFFAIVNTYLALCSAVVGTFIASSLVNPNRRITMEHVQNATLAGGVAMGTAADMKVQPWGALVIGLVGGTLSTLGYVYVKPFIAYKWNIHDTCGVNNLHGMPAILAGLVAIIQLAVYPEPNLSALHQFYALITAFGVAIGGGALTGFVMKIPFIESLSSPEYFEDGKYFELHLESEEEISPSTKKSNVSSISDVNKPQDRSGLGHQPIRQSRLMYSYSLSE